jgi:hypothetical protein
MQTKRIETISDNGGCHALRLIAAAAALVALTACGGGGGKSAANPPQTAEPLGLVQVQVSDRFGAAVPGALVSGPRGESMTTEAGTAFVVTDSPNASANVRVTNDAFVPKTKMVTSVPGQVSAVPIILQRATSPAGGSLASRSGVLATLDSTRRSLTFEVELVVVDGESQPIDNLTAADFSLRPCVPDPASDRFECVRGSVATDDVAYVATTPNPISLTRIPGMPARPFASGLLIDQSGSIADTDPTGARLFASKVFVEALSGDDQVLLAAFAGGPSSRLPGVPLSVFGGFRPAGQTGDYIAALDSLARQVGGSTPLYDSVDLLRQQWFAVAPAPGLGKAIVVFTDGDDTHCGGQLACGERRSQSIQGALQDDVRIFTVGLTKDVDIAALGELANETGGAMLYADNVKQLLPLYGSVGRLMSLSLPTYRLSWTVHADAAGAFQPGQALLGRVQVSVGSNSFEVPFVVGIR